MKIQIIKELGAAGLEIWYKAYEVNEDGTRRFILLHENLEGVEKKINEFKIRKNFQPELIKEIEI